MVGHAADVAGQAHFSLAVFKQRRNLYLGRSVMLCACAQLNVARTFFFGSAGKKRPSLGFIDHNGKNAHVHDITCPCT